MKWITIALAAVCVAGATAASAETVSMDFVGGTGSEPISKTENVAVYPYDFYINGSKTETTLLCISFDDEISNGETWTATVTDLSSSSSTLDKEEAYLFSLITTGMSTTTIADIQFADWYLSDQSGVEGTEFYQDNKSQILYYVGLTKLDGADQTNTFYNEFDLYTPISGTQSEGGLPQTFIGPAPRPPATPEPGSLALLGTGLFGVGGLLRRRMRKV